MTIIVLIILASITILSLTNTKLFSKSKESTDKYKVAQQDEQNILNEYNSYIADNSRETISISKDELNSLVEEILNKKLTERGNSVPIGNIISQMGNEAPDGYLKCDGKEYNIKDYQNLANYFEEQFGSKNYFGGDGNITFNVPDLRGEFLRGTETGNRNTGSGANVGQHQDPTSKTRSWISYENKNIQFYTTINNGYPEDEQNVDKYLNINNIGYKLTIDQYLKQQTNENIGQKGVSFTFRPTNTSVLFCIKY